MPDPQDDDLDRSPLAVATRYSDRQADPGYDPNAPPEYRGQFLNQTLPGNPRGWGPSGEGVPEQPYTGPFADQYEPGWRDAVADWLRSAIGERDKMMSPEGYRAVTGIAGATGAGSRGSSVADFVPGLGLATASMDSAQALHSGNYPIATLAALSGLVPGAIGKFLSKAGRGAVRSVTDPVREFLGNPRPGMTASGPVQARAVHGAPSGEDAYKLDQGIPREDYWASDAPATAQTYTRLERARDPDYDYQRLTPNLTPVDLDFKNALIVNRGGGRHIYHDLPYETQFNGPDRGSTDYLAAYAKAQGHDGLVVHNVQDGLGYYDKAPYATTYAALQPGTVKSALSGAQIFGLAPAAAGAAGMASQDQPSGFADGGTPTYPGDDPDFLSMLANNPHGWGNAPPIPQSVAEQEPWNFPGEARNLPDRPSDPVETPLAESLSPTMGAYGMGDLLGESLNRFASGDLKGSAETALPLLLGIFAGPGARTADMTMLAKAKELAAAKAPREQIWGDTGWFQGKDQGWRHEISDDKSRWNPEIAASGLDVGAALDGYKHGLGRSPLMSDLFEHPELYQAYPGAEKIGLHPIKDLEARGSYDNAGNIGLNTLLTNDDAMKSTNLHELQHVIQQREGFARGASPDAYTPDVLRQGAIQEYDAKINEIRQAGQAVPDDLLKKRNEVSSKTDDFWRKVALSMYRSTAGEAEARNAQTRMNYTPEQRRATPPWETQDVPDIDQIVRPASSSGVQMSRKIPPYPGDEPWWHGSPSGDLRGGTSGLHLGTKEAAEQALTARIGYPASGSWDGSQEYGQTLLAGQKTMRDRGIFPTGRNVRAPEEDYYAADHPEGLLTHGNGDVMDYSNKPSVKQYQITGSMTNSPTAPHNDWKANGYMKAALKKGNAKSGYFYKNEGEDAGSISAVVPNGNHVREIPPYPGDVPMQGSSVSGATPEQVDPSRLLRSHDVEAGSEILPIFRGESVHNKGGNFYTPDRDWARQFTQTGQDHEVKSAGIRASDVYDPPKPAYAGDPDAVDVAIAAARAGGHKAVRLDEGQGQPPSVFVFDKKALYRRPKGNG